MISVDRLDQKAQRLLLKAEEEEEEEEAEEEEAVGKILKAHLVGLQPQNKKTNRRPTRSLRLLIDMHKYETYFSWGK